MVLVAAGLPAITLGTTAGAQAPPERPSAIGASPSSGLDNGDVVTVTETGMLDSVAGAGAFAAQCGFITTAPGGFVCSSSVSEVITDFEGDFTGQVTVTRSFVFEGATYECEVTVKCIIAIMVISPELTLVSSTGVVINFGDPETSPGCQAETLAPGSTSHDIVTADGLTRTYLRHVPAGYAGGPTPVVLNFHGFSSNARQQVALSEIVPVADANNFIVIHPEGTQVNGTSGPQFWNSSGAPSAVDDFGFVAEMLDEIEGDACVALDRVFAMGMSNGGFFSSGLACTLPERIAAIATMTGVLHLAGCNTTRNVPIVHFHGTADAIVDFAPIPAVVDRWAADAGCNEVPTTTAIGQETERRVFTECENGGAVEFYVVTGGGHSWPGSRVSQAAEVILGYTTFDINASQLAWEWFVTHPRTSPQISPQG